MQSLFWRGEVSNTMLESEFIGPEEHVVIPSDKEFAEAKSYPIDKLREYRWIMREVGLGDEIIDLAVHNNYWIIRDELS
ncbi:hypothetical protein [Desulfosediminicola flagellatus]|uniref:hypothetical protein n=1 Tax=Desulfosediminicola flagellatus TaxID=2569541 RepID=UPI0010ACC1EA|nr:hypothetical protein [Desulfosediminicola flagellatus]